jgi:hypothetical protein
MEEDLFIHDPAVAEALSRGFVESRLHTDAHDHYADVVVRGLQDRYTDGNRAQPIYVIVDPATGEARGKLLGARRREFLAFLERAGRS